MFPWSLDRWWCRGDFKLISRIRLIRESSLPRKQATSVDSTSFSSLTATVASCSLITFYAGSNSFIFCVIRLPKVQTSRAPGVGESPGYLWSLLLCTCCWWWINCEVQTKKTVIRLQMPPKKKRALPDLLMMMVDQWLLRVEEGNRVHRWPWLVVNWHTKTTTTTSGERETKEINSVIDEG